MGLECLYVRLEQVHGGNVEFAEVHPCRVERVFVHVHAQTVVRSQHCRSDAQDARPDAEVYVYAWSVTRVLYRAVCRGAEWCYHICPSLRSTHDVNTCT